MGEVAADRCLQHLQAESALPVIWYTDHVRSTRRPHQAFQERHATSGHCCRSLVGGVRGEGGGGHAGHRASARSCRLVLRSPTSDPGRCVTVSRSMGRSGCCATRRLDKGCANSRMHAVQACAPAASRCNNQPYASLFARASSMLHGRCCNHERCTTDRPPQSIDTDSMLEEGGGGSQGAEGVSGTHATAAH